MATWITGTGDPTRASAHREVPLRDVMSQRNEPVAGADGFASGAAITVHLDGTISLRDRTEAFKGAMFAAYPGDVVFSKIDARNGAIGVIPATIAKAILTSEFPVFVPDPDMLDAGFVRRVLRSGHFLGAIRLAATGTSGRKRITPERFLDLAVPLPPLDQQRAIMAAHDALIAQAAALDAQADQAEADALAAFEKALGYGPQPPLPDRPIFIARFRELDRWSHDGILRAQLGIFGAERPFAETTLGEVGRVAYGLQKAPSNRPGQFARPYLRVANVQRWRLDLSEVKEIEVPDEAMSRFRLEPGDILLCEGNSADLVGRGAIWQGEIPDCVHQNHVLRVRLSQQLARPRFVLAVINSQIGTSHFRASAKRTTNLASINSREVAALRFPLPPLDVQDTMIAALDAARAEAARLRVEAEALRARAAREFEEAVYGSAEAETPAEPAAA